jgi:hypothetical protein
MLPPTHPLKSGYVWMLIAIPLSAVIMGVILLYLAITTFDGMVVDDYYQRGLEINEDLSRDQAALRAEIVGQLDASPTFTEVRLISSDPLFNSPNELNLNFSHATRDGIDQTMVLRQTGVNVYRGPALELAALGRWYVQVSGGEWRISGDVQMGVGDTSLSLDLSAPKAKP